MTDYTKATGASGTMMIRDTGTSVEFWLKAGSATYNHQLPWGYGVNGVTDKTNSFNFVAGGNWQKLAGWGVSTNQTVTFYLLATGTSGLGGPTTFSVNISRAKVPNAPTTPVISQISATSVFATFSDGANNGAAINQRQLAYSTVPTGGQVYPDSDGSTLISGLTSGVTYYFWARTHNAIGWSPWSARSSATTLKVPAAPSPVTLSGLTQTTIHATFTDNSNGGSTILERRVGYGTSSSAPQSYISGNNVNITGLTPGIIYYFWSQSRNVVGWSPLSVVRSTLSLAGARVNVSGVWKPAIPYIRDAGVWKVARPWGRVAGVWKETI
jgi:hypothetical protein